MKKAARARSGSFPDADFFGLNAEGRIIQSGVREVFTPHKPISEATLLFGRKDEVRKLIETLNTPGQHMLLFGERGVGKSSLANVAVVVSCQSSGVYKKVFTKRCDQSDTFESIVRPVLNWVGSPGALREISRSESRQYDIKIGGGSTTTGRTSKADQTATFDVGAKVSPSTVADAICDVSGLLVIDEFDAIQLGDDRRRVAELIKQLSDRDSKLKVLVVGIAESSDQLTTAHPSVQRCLRETKLWRMQDGELEEVIEVGSQLVSVTFEGPVVEQIVKLSAGYPHFTHLLALKSAEKSIGAGREKVSELDFLLALDSAAADVEGSLKRSYDDGTRSSSSEMYGHILAAAASLDTDEFSSTALRASIEERTGDAISQGSLNNYFQRLMSSDRSTILTRTGKGVYRFTDPRMRSYVRILHKMI